MSTLFDLSFLLVAPFWLLLVVAPRWRWTRRLTAPPWPALPAALLYTILALPAIGSLLPAVASPELTAIAALLGEPTGATIAWVHFLAFDLFVASWIHRDALARGYRWWWVAPLLLLSLLLGPAGLLSYGLLRVLLSPRPNPPALSDGAAPV